MIGQHVQDHPRSLMLVFEVRRVNEHLLIVLDSQLHVFLKDRRLVGRVLVQPDLADPQDVWTIEELRDHFDHLARQRNVFGFLGVNA